MTCLRRFKIRRGAVRVRFYCVCAFLLIGFPLFHVAMMQEAEEEEEKH